MQETDNLPSQRGRLQQIARGFIRIEELLLEGGGDGVPLRNEGRLEAYGLNEATMAHLEAAPNIAKDAAPFRFPKLSTVKVGTEKNPFLPDNLNADELRAEIIAGLSKLGFELRVIPAQSGNGVSNKAQK